jgi:hypothetical protein
MADPTHPSMMIEDLASFYQGNTVPFETRTPPPSSKKPSHASS